MAGQSSDEPSAPATGIKTKRRQRVRRQISPAALYTFTIVGFLAIILMVFFALWLATAE